MNDLQKTAFPSASHRVVVTAAGVASPLGIGLDETLVVLRAGRDCVSPVTTFDVSKTRCSTAGQIDDALLSKALADFANSANGEHPKKFRRLHRASRMMIVAAHELANSDPAFQPSLMVIGTTSGGMTFGESFFRSLLANRDRRSRPAWLANYNPQKPLLDAQAALGISAPGQIIANACASGTNAIGHAFSLIRSGLHERVLCGGYDAVSELVFVGFDSLQASTPEKIRPFDKARTGLVLGEGAALLALESRESAIRRGAPILAEISGYGVSTDNYHLTQPHPSGIGPLTAMRRALVSAGKSPNEIDYINAHGTATAFNDATEGTAISQLFGERVPVSSTKSMMGHSLGAAGAIEAVFCLLALQHQFLPPNIHFREPELPLNIVANHERAAELNAVISNSFGFGGTNATIVMERTRA